MTKIPSTPEHPSGRPLQFSLLGLLVFMLSWSLLLSILTTLPLSGGQIIVVSLVFASGWLIVLGAAWWRLWLLFLGVGLIWLTWILAFVAQLGRWAPRG